MIVLGLLLILVAVGATVFAVMAPSAAAQTIEVSALGFKVSASPLAMFVAGALDACGDDNAEPHLRRRCDALLQPGVIDRSNLSPSRTGRAGWFALHQHARGGERCKVRCGSGAMTCQNRAGQNES